ncbi:hypothetical protein ACEPAI_7457 [Sanghuangporus weigelae]
MWLRIYTTLLWILDTVYLILVLRFLYVYFVREFGNIHFLGHLRKDTFTSALFSPVICALVQLFYITRAHSLSKGNLLMTSGLAICTIALLMAKYVYLYLVHVEEFASLIKLEIAMNAMGFFTDTIIALALIFLLCKHRPGFKKTERIITRLVAFTIGTGLITSVVAFVAFVSAIVLPHALVYLFMDFCMSKLYYNCMLASLNSRSSLREKMDRTSEMLSFHLEDMAAAGSEVQAVSRSTSIVVNS